MARPKSDDPKEALTVRVPRSLAQLVTVGDDWRARLEAVIAAHYAQVAVVRAAPRAKATVEPAVHVAVPVFERKRFVQHLKPGKR